MENLPFCQNSFPCPSSDRSHIGVQVQDDEGVGCRHHLAQWVPHVEKLYPGSWQHPEEVQIHHDLVLVLATVLVLGPP